MKIRINTHGGPLPVVKGDWIDLTAAEEVTIEKGDYKEIPLGVSMELPEGHYALVLPRSSTFKNYGVMMANSMAVINRDFCGDGDIWKFLAYATRDTTIPKGARICQFQVVKTDHNATEIEFEPTDCLGNPNRGGVGSTGK